MHSADGTYSVDWTVQPFCQTQINRCLPIISSESNKLIHFPKHCSQSRYRAALGIYVVFTGTAGDNVSKFII